MAPDEPVAAGSPDETAIAERVALSQARAELLARVHALGLPDGGTVAAWSGASLPLDRALRRFIFSLPPARPPRLYSDGSREVDVRLEPAKLREVLLELRTSTARDAANGPSTGQIETAASTWPILWGTGSAELTTLADAQGVGPPGWEDVRPEGISLARDAARADAIFALLQEAGRLKVTNARRLEELLAADRKTRDRFLAALGDAAEVSVTFDPDQVATATARLALRELLRVLLEMQANPAAAAPFREADIRELALHTQTVEIAAQGIGIPPAACLLRVNQDDLVASAPAWAHEIVEVVGRAAGPPGAAEVDAHLEGSLAAQVARIDAIRQIRARILSLPVASDQYAEDLLRDRPRLADDVWIFLNGARNTAPPSADAAGCVLQPVELPLMRLWLIVRRGLHGASEAFAGTS